MNDNIIRVMIADDFEIIRHGIKRVLEFEDNIRVIAEAVDGKEVMTQVNMLKPDLLLLDMSMPGYSGLEILKQIRADNIDIKVIMLTVESSSDVINASIEYGADGYVLKESTTNEVVEAINTVYGGGKYLDKSLLNILFEKHGSNNKDNVFNELNSREIEVLYFLSKGLSNKEIGNELYLSEKTIKNNLTRLFKKIDAKDRVHAAIFGINNNIEKYYNRD